MNDGGRKSEMWPGKQRLVTSGLEGGREPRAVGGRQKLKRAGSSSPRASGRDTAPQHLAVSPGSLCRLLTSETVRRQVGGGGVSL